jgi:hypothetical protein
MKFLILGFFTEKKTQGWIQICLQESFGVFALLSASFISVWIVDPVKSCHISRERVEIK